MSKVTCIDVSCWQTGVDYKKVKADGITSVIIRAGYGRETSQKDSQFETHYKNAKANGLKIGAYWYSYADSVSDAKKEAKACLSVIKGKSFNMPIFIDMEDGSQVKYGKTILTNIAKTFCDEIKKAGYKSGVYANLNWFNNYLDYNSLKARYPIWLAQYNSTNDKSCDIWQNSSSGRINGISGNVDTNIIFNSSVIKGNSVSHSATTSKPTNTIKYSSAVKEWQKAMNKGFDTKELVEDGIFGSKSKAFAKSHVLYMGIKYNCPTAIKWLQSKIGTTQDGIFGAKTKSKLKEYQKKNKLAADGECGLKTYKKILKV